MSAHSLSIGSLGFDLPHPQESDYIHTGRAESSRVQSSTVETNQTRKDAAETVRLTYYGHAWIRTDTIQSSSVESSPVPSDSPGPIMAARGNACTSAEASRVPRVLPS
jgi:hypothetical protein